MHRLIPSNPLPHAPCHGATVLPIGQALAAADLKAAPVLSEGDELAEFAECPAFAAPAKITVIDENFSQVLADIRNADAEEAARAPRPWSETAVEKAAAALPPKINDRQVIYLLRAVLAAYDQEGDALGPLEDCIDEVVSRQVAGGIDEAEAAEAAYPQLVPLQACKGA